MNVEQEYFFDSSFLSVHRFLALLGTMLVIALAKSALTITRSAMSVPFSVRTPIAVLPSMMTSSTASPSRNCTPISSAISAMRTGTEPSPPVGWKIPYSYSRNARMVNKLGQLNGDIPRYLVWNDIASISRSSSNKRIKSLATDRVGRKTVAARMTRLEKMSVGPFHGSCKQALARWSFLRLSSTYRTKAFASFSPESTAIRSRMTSRSLVQSSSPPCPKMSR